MFKKEDSSPPMGPPAGMEIPSTEESSSSKTEDCSSMIKSMLNKLMSKLDKDGDGIVTQEEIEEASKNGEQTETEQSNEEVNKMAETGDKPINLIMYSYKS